MALLPGPGVRGLHCLAWRGSDLAPWPGVTICPHRISPHRQAGRALPLTPCGPPQTPAPRCRTGALLQASASARPLEWGCHTAPLPTPSNPGAPAPRTKPRLQPVARAGVCAALSLRPRPPPRKLRRAASCFCLRSKARSPRVSAALCLPFHRQRVSCSFWSPPREPPPGAIPPRRPPPALSAPRWRHTPLGDRRPSSGALGLLHPAAEGRGSERAALAAPALRPAGPAPTVPSPRGEAPGQRPACLSPGTPGPSARGVSTRTETRPSADPCPPDRQKQGRPAPQLPGAPAGCPAACPPRAEAAQPELSTQPAGAHTDTRRTHACTAHTHHTALFCAMHPVYRLYCIIKTRRSI